MGTPKTIFLIKNRNLNYRPLQRREAIWQLDLLPLIIEIEK